MLKVSEQVGIHRKPFRPPVKRATMINLASSQILRFVCRRMGEFINNVVLQNEAVFGS